jgi:hypothetical protein
MVISRKRGDKLNSSYFVIIFLFVVLFVLLRRRKNIIAQKAIKKRRKDNTEMVDLAKKFIGKECLISAFDGNHQFSGVIKEVSNGALLLENNGSVEAINLDFVIRIREYPKNKNGKKKSVILD